MSRPTKRKCVKVHQMSVGILQGIKLEEEAIPDLQPDQILIKMLAAPINPSDLMFCRGDFPMPELPFGAGKEGVAEVIETGSDVTCLKVGDRVIPQWSPHGTWCDYCVYKASEVRKIDPEIPVKSAATMFVNATTAYFLVTETGLQPGQTLIQNGANSLVGKAIIQIAKLKGIKTINVVRNRPNLAELVAELKQLGADDVITDEYLREGKLETKVPIAIDCVAGEPGALLINQLERGGTLFNYGYLSRQPIPVPSPALLFNKVIVKGYVIFDSLTSEERARDVFEILTKLIKEGKLKPPQFETFKLEDFKKGIERALAGFANKKQILVMNDCAL